MGEERIRVKVSAQAKVGNRWIPAGGQDVTSKEFEALEAAGLIEPDQDGFKALVASSDARINRTFVAEIERLRSENEALAADMDQQLATASENLAIAVARAESAEKAYADHVAQVQVDVSRMQQRNAELEATIAALTPPDGERLGAETAGTDTAQPQSGTVQATQDTPPTAKAAKTTRKKGAAATTKG